MTFQDLLLRVSHKTGLSDIASSAEQSFLIEGAKEAVRKVLLDTGCHVTQYTLNLTANVDEYVLTSTILATVDYQPSVTNTTIMPIAAATSGDVLYRRSIGTVGAAREFTILGDNVLIVSPTPTAAETWLLYVVLDGSLLSALSNATITADLSNASYGGIPIWAQSAVELYLLAYAAQKNQSLATVQFYADAYEKECGHVRKYKRGLEGRRMPPPRIGYPGKPNRPLGRNDVYPGSDMAGLEP